MTRDDMLRIANEAGWPPSLIHPVIMDKLRDFAELVLEVERQRFAELCESKIVAEHATGKVDHVQIVRLTGDGIILNPEISVDDAARRVIDIAQDYIRYVVFRAVADEREQCALVAEELRPSKPEYDQRFYDGCTFTAMAIRKRGEK